MFRKFVTVLAVSTALSTGAAHALTFETPKGDSVTSDQAQIADPDSKLNRWNLSSSQDNKAANPNSYTYKGSGFSLGISGGQGGQRNETPSNTMRFGPSTSSDQVGNSRLNSVFSPGMQ